MSWISSRQHAGGQPLPPATSVAAPATGPPTGSMGFGGKSGVGGNGANQQHPQQQGWQPQPLHAAYNHQTQQYPSQPNNNLYNLHASQSTQNARNNTQQAWQQPKPPQQQQQQLPPPNSQYFNKQNPVVDSYTQQNLVASHTLSSQSTPQHYQHQQPPQPSQTNFYQQNLSVANTYLSNATNNQQSFLKPELQAVGTMASTTATTTTASPLQNDNQPGQGEGWDDWDWNDNNNQSLLQSQQQMNQQGESQQQNNMQNVVHHDVIADSFATNQMDNWKWNTDDSKNSNVIQQSNDIVQNQFISHEQQHNADSYGPASIGVISTTSSVEDPLKSIRPPSVGSASSGYVQSVMQPPQFSAQQTHQSVQQPQSTVQQLPPAGQSQLPAPAQQISPPLSILQPPAPIQQSQSAPPVQPGLIMDSSSSPVTSNVYVSQAKPVSQPTRQYAMTPSLAGQTTPPNTIINNQTDSLPPPTQISSTPSLPPPPSINQTPPPPPVSSSPGANPYKRAGVAQHHRVALNSTVPAKTQPIAAGSQAQSHFFGPVSGDFQQVQHNIGGNQEILAPDNSEIIADTRSFEVENQEVAPSNDRNQFQEVALSNDRNQYLQTDHLSEGGYNNVELTQEQNEQDSFPPPGLSRLVLGQPEIENPVPDLASQSEIPPGFDRMVPGTELVTAGINMERQADGQDTIPAPRSVFSNAPSVPLNNSISSNIDITTDRNLYLVPGESDAHEQRFVPGLENGAEESGTTEPREVELDGENLEDQQQQQQQLLQQQHQSSHHVHHHHHQPPQQQHYQPADIEITREEPIEGANTMDSLTSPNATHETESSLTIETNQKDMSNPSTCNDDSDHKPRNSHYYGKSNSRKQEEKRRQASGNDSKDRKERFDTESDYYSSDRDRKFREGSIRSDRDRKSKERDHRDRREGSVRDQERYRDEKDDRDGRKYDRDRQRGKHDRERDRDRDRDRNGRYNGNRYETDSKYETESSTRYERRRGDRDRHDYDYRRDEKDKRHRRGERERHDRDERDRRRDNERDYRDRRRGDTRGDRGRGGGGSSNEYDEDTYSRRTVSSRNARDTERDYKDRSMRDGKDPRYPANMYGYPSGYGYDAYSYYQHQQYYEQLRRTNPQAYAEWYRKYYSQVQNDMMTHDGRESVHSGRSSANNEKDRYSYQQHQHYFQQYSNDYQQQRHFMHPPSIGSSLNSTSIVDQTFHHLNGSSSTANLSQYHLQQYQQQLATRGVGTTSVGGYPVASSARSYYSQNDYMEIRSDQFNASINLIDGASTTQEPQRLTPCKFTNGHSVATLTNGLMVCVKPKYASNGVTNIVKVWKFTPHDSTKRLFSTFPGPLVRGITHKKTIIEFCEDQIRLGPPSILLRSRNNSVSSICSIGQTNKASFTLMWTLLILLLRQNGMVVGTDIAELLMKNKTQYPYEITAAGNSSAIKSSSASRPNSTQSDHKKSHDSRNSQSDVDDNDDADSIDDKDESSEGTDSKKSFSEGEVTEKFRNYLLYGNVNEALEWATDNNLWGHALFLASKVDRRLHANVMMKFANKLSLNDPLQTLYQLMSGRSPSSVTSVQDEKWGDWRPHLAMILSNTSPRPELDRKAITTLGDSLYNRGDLFGAQFCYLMAQVGFGRYSSVNQESSFMSNSVNAVRLVLLGSSHHKTFREFATNEAIMMTEIYEYACALNDDKFSIVEFQPYKYLLALRMLDYGMQLKTLMYMEQISRHIQLDPAKYDASFIQKVYNLSDRLKYVDPMLEKSLDDQQGNEINQFEDQPWLQSLRDILSDANIYAPLQTTDIPSRSQIDQQFAEINQQFNALNLQYNNFDTNIDQQQHHLQQEQQSYSGGQSEIPNGTQYQTQYQQQTSNSGVDSGPQSTDQYSQFYNPNQQHIPSLPGQNSATSDYGSYGPQSYEQPASYEQEQYQQIPTDTQHMQGQGYGGGYWDQQAQPNETPRPQISMPNAISNKSGFYDDTTNETSTPAAISSKSNDKGNLATDKKSSSAGASKSDSKKQNSGGSGTNSGWFGGIWNKLSLKPKNQMILPDDKNPAIVWDSDKKRWINTDGDEAEQDSFRPPPKMADIVQTAYNVQAAHNPSVVGSDVSASYLPLQQQQQQHNQQQSQSLNYGQQDVPMFQQSTISNVSQSSTSPGLTSSATNTQTNSMSASGNAAAAGGAGVVTGGSTGSESMKTPSLQSNMFKMQRNRTLKKSYVDVFNPSGAPTKPIEPVLAPMLPSATVPQGGIFVPAPVPSDDGSVQQQHQGQEGMPQFYNPNQFSGYPQQQQQ